MDINGDHRTGAKAQPLFMDQDPEHFKHIINYVIPEDSPHDFKFFDFHVDDGKLSRTHHQVEIRQTPNMFHAIRGFIIAKIGLIIDYTK